MNAHLSLSLLLQVVIQLLDMVPMRWDQAKAHAWLVALGIPAGNDIMTDAENGDLMFDNFCTEDALKELDYNLTDGDPYDGIFAKDDALKQRVMAAFLELSEVSLECVGVCVCSVSYEGVSVWYS